MSGRAPSDKAYFNGEQVVLWANDGGSYSAPDFDNVSLSANGDGTYTID